MNKEDYYNYLKSKEWADIKIDLIQTRGPKCERCGTTRKHFRYLHIHHLTYKNIGNEKPEDLEILCAPCHRKEHGIEKKRLTRKLTIQQRNRNIIEGLRSKKGGFTAKALKRLGVSWPPKQGWKKKLEDGPLIKLKPVKKPKQKVKDDKNRKRILKEMKQSRKDQERFKKYGRF